MDFCGFSWKYCRDTGRITGAYIIFYKGGKVYHGIHVLGPVAQSSSEIYYNSVCTAGMDLEIFSMLTHEFLNKDTDIFPLEAPLIILYRKSDVCMDNNGKDTKHTRHISRRVNYVRNGGK